MPQQPLSRRRFIEGVVAGSALAATRPARARAVSRGTSSAPALLGGTPVRRDPFPSWPVVEAREQDAVLDVVRSGDWFRGEQVAAFEARYAALTGARHCLATANGTSALVTSLAVLGIGPGDEVIVPPYTFVATVNAVLLMHALPVFVDTNPRTFQIDARKLPAAITDRTRAIIPVHIGGGVADLDAVLAAARPRSIPVVEDACQAHLAEWRGRKVGTLGTTGCFSFQASKNLNSGEGGAMLTGDDAVIEAAYRFHNNSRGRRNTGPDFSYRGTGANLRMTEFQAALLMAQMERVEAQARTREQNAEYLSGLLRQIPGITPAGTHDGCTRQAYHIYMLRYDPEPFAGLPRATFLEALRAEGIPCSGGYSPLNTQPFLDDAFSSRGYQTVYTKAQLEGWRERTRCPENDRLCGEAVWFGQTMLLGGRADMDHIAEAIRKIHTHAGRLKAREDATSG